VVLVVVVIVIVVVVKLNSVHRSIVFRPQAPYCVLFINYICCLHEKLFCLLSFLACLNFRTL